MKKILIIDDDKDFCYVIKRRLSDLGDYRVLIAKGNNMGRWISRCRWHRPDLILLDIMIPGIDGFEILERLKKDSVTSAIPIIILSAKTDLESKKRAQALGSEDYIFKPVEAEALRDRIEKVLAKNRLR
jgi:CheY-like chemotaxis protein